MPWNSNYEPEEPNFDIDEWLSQQNFGDNWDHNFDVNDLDISTQMSDYVGVGYSNYEDDISQQWNLDTWINNFQDIDQMDTNLWNAAQADMDTVDFGKFMFMQMWDSASHENKQQFMDQWNESFGETGLGFDITYNAIGQYEGIEQAASVWANTYQGVLDYDNWFDNSALATEVGQLSGSIVGALDEFNSLYGNQAGYAPTYAAVEAQGQNFAANARDFLNSYTETLGKLSTAGENVLTSYGQKAKEVRGTEATRGVYKKRGNLLSDGSADLRLLRNQLRGINVGIESNETSYEANIDQNNALWNNLLHEEFGVGGYYGDYLQAFEALLDEVDGYVDSWNLIVGDEVNSQLADMWSAIGDIAAGQGLVPPSDSSEGFGNFGGYNCVTSAGTFGFHCPWSPGSCVEDMSECPEEPQGNDATCSAQCPGNSGVWDPTTWSCNCTYTEQEWQSMQGCINPNAWNYNPGASIDDGSCLNWGSSLHEQTGCSYGQHWNVATQSCVEGFGEDGWWNNLEPCAYTASGEFEIVNTGDCVVDQGLWGCDELDDCYDDYQDDDACICTAFSQPPCCTIDSSDDDDDTGTGGGTGGGYGGGGGGGGGGGSDPDKWGGKSEDYDILDQFGGEY